MPINLKQKYMNCHPDSNISFTVGYDNRIRFSNGTKATFIDDYSDRESLRCDFLKTALQGDCLGKKMLDSSVKLDFQPEYSYQDMIGYSLRRSLDKGVLNEGRHYLGKIFCFTNYYCNNNCEYCFGGEKTKRKNFSLNELEHMIEDLSSEYREIHFGGGEPTLFKGLEHLIEFSKKRNLSAWLLTNGRRFSYRNFAKEIIDSGLDGMIVCLNSHIAQIHDSLTQRQGSFKETVSGIRNLMALGFKNFDIILIINRKNYKDLKATAQFLAGEGIGGVAFESLVYVGNAAKNIQTLGVKLKDTAIYIQDALDVLIEKNLKVRITSFPLCLFKSRYWKYFINRRYEVLATNFSHADGGCLYHRYKSSGLRLSVKCLECRLKTFCAGAWESYYYFYSDEEFRPIKNISNEEILSLVSSHSVNFALAPAK
ncbi:MAG: radical SAM protein [Candidatus Omnitrophota bacterium]